MLKKHFLLSLSMLKTVVQLDILHVFNILWRLEGSKEQMSIWNRHHKCLYCDFWSI